MRAVIHQRHLIISSHVLFSSHHANKAVERIHPANFQYHYPFIIISLFYRSNRLSRVFYQNISSMQHGRNFCCRYLPAFLCAVPLQEEKTDTNFKKGCFSEKEPDFFNSRNNKSPENFAARDTSPSTTTSIPQFVSPPASTFRKRRLSKAHHNHAQEAEDEQTSSSATTIEQRDRDTFLYAAEIEGLVEEHPLQTPHSHFSSAHSITLPFSDRSVGAYSCT